MRLLTFAPLGAIFYLLAIVAAQQFAGDVIPNSLPGVPGSEVTYFRIADPAGKATNLTLTNYFSFSNGQRLDPTKVQRAVIIVHGLDRDPGTYMSNMLSALAQTTPNNADVNFGSVQIMAPYFPNGDDKNFGYPWTAGLKPGRGSTSNALVWQASQWSAGGNNQYPYTATTVSSYDVLDQLVQYFDNKSIYPNLKQIVVAGHSLGGQTVGRYAQIGKILNTVSPVSHWIANPNSWAWLSTSRPLDTSTCPTYDNWREGYTNFTQYPMTYAVSLVAQGRSAVYANYMQKSKIYARGTLDTGDDSSTCGPFTTGINRNERFFNFIKAFPPVCTSPSGQCDTVDYVKVGHDGGAMMASAAGQARLFLDNFYGDGKRAYDFGYPRLQAGDDPYPDPNGANATSNGNTVYPGNMTSQGCWTDNVRNVRALSFLAYDNSSNSVNQCTSTCATAGYSIAGTEFGTQCFCGNQVGPYTTSTVSEGCTMACPGNSTQICGDSNRLSLYSNGIPSQAALPGTPEVVGNYVSYYCYTEATSGRALSGKSYSDGTSMTLESCAAFCNGYQYFGVEYSSECYCGNSFGAGAAITSDSDCSMTCSGNALEYCGAGNRLTVYTLQSGASVSTITQGPLPTTTTAGTGSTSSGSTGTAPAGSTPPVASASLCPTTNGQTLSSSGGNNYTITCSSDSTIGAYQGVGATSSYIDCMGICDSQANCKSFVYVGGNGGSGAGTCWLKSDTGSSSPAGANYIFAVKASSSSSSGTATGGSSTTSGSSTAPTAVSCPGSNSTIYTATSGATFLIECGIDHVAGDLSATGVPTFAACIEACANATGCVDVSLSGNACYLKSTLGAAENNAGIWGAKLTKIASPMPSSSPVNQVGTTFATSASGASVSSVPSSGIVPSSTSVSLTVPTSSSLVSSSASSLKNLGPTSSLTTPTSVSSSVSMASSASTIYTSPITSTSVSSFTSISLSSSGSTAFATSTASISFASASTFTASGSSAALSTSQIQSPSISSAVSMSTTRSGSAFSSGTFTGALTSTLVASSTLMLSSSGPASSAATASASAFTSSTISAFTTPALVSSILSSHPTLPVATQSTESTSSLPRVTTPASSTTVSTPSAIIATATQTTTSLSNTAFASGPAPSSILTSATTSTSSRPSPTSSATLTSTSVNGGSSSTSTSSSNLPSNPLAISASSSTSKGPMGATPMTLSTTALPSSNSGIAQSTSASLSQSSNAPSTSAATTSTTTSTRSSTTTTAPTSPASQATSSAPATSRATTTSPLSPTTSATAAASPVILPSGFTPLGCIPDSATARVFSDLSYSNKSNTPATCALSCRAQGYQYSGTQYGSECFCSSTVPSPFGTVAGCTARCAGDRSQVCGGSLRLSVVRDEEWAPRFSVRQSYGGWQVAGCFSEPKNGRALASSVITVGGAANFTVANCLEACAAKGLGWCGVEYSRECFGAKVAPAAVLALMGDPIAAGCGVACKGNASEACGGGNRLLVYVNGGGQIGA